MLAFDFDVAALATDGDQAIEEARRVEPDIVVLDITMPGLDGFQAARELTRNGSGPRVVFLTMHDAEEFIVEGFRSGGQGYVVKTRVHEDLVRAMHRVLAGQLFVPTLKSLLLVDDACCGHATQIYSDEDGFIDSMGDFIDTALRCGDAVSVVAKPSVRAGLAGKLQDHGWRVSDSGGGGRYRAMDAADALSSIMQGGCPAEDRLARIVDDLEATRISNAQGKAKRHTVVGEIAAPLFESGDWAAGIEVERLWNTLTQTRQFLTVCCYPAACVPAESGDDVYPRLCAEHWAVA